MGICSSHRWALTQHQCTATLFLAKSNPQCSVLLCKSGSQQGCVTAITPMEICCSYRCAVTHHQCTATLFLAKSNLHCPVLLCKTGSQQGCVIAITPMEICCSYRCAVTQHKCTATQFLAKSNPQCSVLLCKSGSQQGCVTVIISIGLCQCSYTFGDLLFIQVCSDPLQCTATLFWAKSNPHCSVLLCKTGSQQGCVSEIISIGLCQCSYTFGDLLFIQVCSDPLQCTATLFWAKSNPHCSVLLCKTGSQQGCVSEIISIGLCQCSYTFGDLLFIQVCSDPTPVHCNTRFGKKQSPLLSAAVHNRFTAGLCQCNYTYRVVSVHSHLWGFALHTGGH